MTVIRSMPLLFVSLLFGACGPVREMPRVPVDDRTSTSAAGSGPAAAVTGRRAVLALLRRAQALQAQGKYARAAALVERALRIEPENPVVWQRMAGIRLQQARYRQAESLAMRALSLAGPELRLRLTLWRMIARSRYQRGDWRGADRAVREVVGLQRRIHQTAPANR